MRSIVAAVVAVLLTTATSWGSACDLSCSLARMAGCQTFSSLSGKGAAFPARAVSSTSEKGAMGGMDMSGMQSEHAGEQASVTQSVAASACASAPCDKASMSATSAAGWLASSGGIILAADVFQVVAPAILIGSESREAPPPKFAAVSPLAVSLRI